MNGSEPRSCHSNNMVDARPDFIHTTHSYYREHTFFFF